MKEIIPGIIVVQLCVLIWFSATTHDKKPLVSTTLDLLEWTCTKLGTESSVNADRIDVFCIEYTRTKPWEK